MALSDAAFHKLCFQADPNAGTAEQLYNEWRSVYDSRPHSLAADQEKKIEQLWVREFSAGISAGGSVR